MSRARIRLATGADVARLVSLRRAWSEEWSGSVDDGDGFERAFEKWFAGEGERRTTWIAEVGQAAVGMLNLVEFRRMPRPGETPARWGYVANVFVLAAHRDAGIGAQLLAAAVAEARARGYVRLVLNPSEPSVPFYERAGFRPSGLLTLPLR